MPLQPLTLDRLHDQSSKPDYETSYRLAAFIESLRSGIKGGIPSHFDPIGTAKRGETEGASITIGSTVLEGVVCEFWMAGTDAWHILIGGHGTDVRHRWFEGDHAAFQAWIDGIDARGLLPADHVGNPDCIVTPMRLQAVVGPQTLDTIVEVMTEAKGPWAVHQNGAFDHEFYNVTVTSEEDALLAASVSTTDGCISGIGFRWKGERAHATDAPVATDETVRAGIVPKPIDMAALYADGDE